LLQSKFQTQHILLSGIPPMHLFPALPQPLRWFLGRRALQFNGALKKLAEGCEPCEFVAIDFPLDTTYMAADGFHPGALAYSLWANHLAAIIRVRLGATVKHSCPNTSRH
jgi:lysophospholipase L1-like esterase